MVATMVHWVTPCVGVWIEMIDKGVLVQLILSLPAWECGLKCRINHIVFSVSTSLPAWECGLKLDLPERMKYNNMSLPAWECGLK